MIEVKANEDLFDRWKMLGNKVQSQNAIVQNDMKLEDSEFHEWLQTLEVLLEEFKSLALETGLYLKGT